MKQTIAVVSVLIMLLSVSSSALSADQTTNPPSAEEIVLDAILIRPLGIASIAAGTVFFVAALPFTIPSRSVGIAARRLVAEPFKFTFTRPMGERAEYIYYDTGSSGKK